VRSTPRSTSSAPTRRWTVRRAGPDRGRIATIAGFARARRAGHRGADRRDGGQEIRDASRAEVIALAADGKLDVTVDKALSLDEAPERIGTCRPVMPEGKSYWFLDSNA